MYGGNIHYAIFYLRVESISEKLVVRVSLSLELLPQLTLIFTMDSIHLHITTNLQQLQYTLHIH